MIFVYSFLAISLLVLVAISRLDRLSPRIFLVYGVTLSVLALLKPLGTTPDDLNYVELATVGCTSFACDSVLSLSRDFIWFFLVSLAPPNSARRKRSGTGSSSSTWATTGASTGPTFLIRPLRASRTLTSSTFLTGKGRRST